MDAPTLPAGTWRGTNTFRLMPSDDPATAPLTLVVADAGALLQVRYVWEHPSDGPQHGGLAVGPAHEGDGHEEDGTALIALWRDTWHQPEARVVRGTIGDGAIALEYSYEGDWTWRILMEHPAADTVVLRMVNVVPASVTGSEALSYDAMCAHLRPEISSMG
ncbi:hypothetical protein [Serinibacter salmoneus]|uniref:DUF1579 domain-containing protein n=1 Tax=Serinibacter salmoneus TaxID=556530 RepID=A0A2A9D5U7_9MICO|nr:hypothetical protein [Serinibacter salmoneus]PFG21219.1 hypothetical protein ATL40_2842 [Serinibacter salmoneus]